MIMFVRRRQVLGRLRSGRDLPLYPPNKMGQAAELLFHSRCFSLSSALSRIDLMLGPLFSSDSSYLALHRTFFAAIRQNMAHEYLFHFCAAQFLLTIKNSPSKCYSGRVLPCRFQASRATAGNDLHYFARSQQQMAL